MQLQKPVPQSLVRRQLDPAVATPATLHVLRARKETVHWGYFDASLAPALRVKSGDLVRIEAVTHHAGDAPDLLMDQAIRQLYGDVPEADRNPGVHIMTGPIFV